jgi:hypothetical protein
METVGRLLTIKEVARGVGAVGTDHLDLPRSAGIDAVVHDRGRTGAAGGIEAVAAGIGPQVVQEEVAVEAVDGAQRGGVAGGAADHLEECASRFDP